jgi:hypothetical protein
MARVLWYIGLNPCHGLLWDAMGKKRDLLMFINNRLSTTEQEVLSGTYHCLTGELLLQTPYYFPLFSPFLFLFPSRATNPGYGHAFLPLSCFYSLLMPPFLAMDACFSLFYSWLWTVLRSILSFPFIFAVRSSDLSSGYF